MPSNTSDLPVDRKSELCSGKGMWEIEAIPEVGLESVVATDGPHGVRLQDPDGSSFISALPSTCFPTASALAASWDRQLLAAVGAAIGDEARDMGVGVVLGPGANIKRHPCGGRSFEYFSEDPLLTGEMAAAFIDGIQSTGVGACLKHFVANNQETRRMGLDVVVDERALREIYLAGFERAVKDGKPWSVMCAYNKVNGVYCADHRELLTGVLRDEWGFDGAVISDWGAVHDRVDGVRAGLDLEMPGGDGVNDRCIADAVASGDLPEEVLDRTVDRILTLVERVSAPNGRAESAPDHHALARRVAAQTAVLLKNDGVLPLAAGQRVAAIGEFAKAPRYQGAGSSQVTPTRVDCAFDTIVELSGDSALVTYSRGYEVGEEGSRADLVDEAVAAAAEADVAVVFIGLPPTYESEGFDRDHLRLPPVHDELVRVVAAANSNTVVVLCNGAPVEMPWVDQPGAILESYLGGQASGGGIGDVLFGVVNPSAKLAETFPLSRSRVSADRWFPGTGRQVQYREGVFVGYRWTATAEVDVLFPFGHGLSYTTFEYSDIALSAGRFDSDHDESITVSVRVTNVGDRAGAEIVQLYVGEEMPVIERPRIELKGFERVELDPGESAEIGFELDRRCFAFFDPPTTAWQVAGGAFGLHVGASSADLRQSTSVLIDSSFAAPDPADRAVVAIRDLGSLGSETGFASRLGRPVPKLDPARPFTRDSTIEEIGQVWPGRRFRDLLMWRARSQFGEADDTQEEMLDRGTAEAPLRFVSQLTQGQLPMAVVDKLVWLCNHWPTLSGAVRRRRRP